MEESKSYIDISKLRNFDEIFSDTRTFFKEHWRLYFWLLLLYAGPFIAIAQYMNAQVIETLLKTIETESIDIPEVSMTTAIVQQLFAFAANIVVNGITLSFITVYALRKEITHASVMEVFNKNLVLFISASLISDVILNLAFQFYIIPGIILFIPLSFYVYDKLLHKGIFVETFSRIFALTRSNLKLSIGTVVTTYALFSIIAFICVIIPFISTTPFIISGTIFLTLATILGGFIMVPIVLLYHTLYITTFDTPIKVEKNDSIDNKNSNPTEV